MSKVPFSESLSFFRHFLQKLNRKNWFVSFIATAFLIFCELWRPLPCGRIPSQFLCIVINYNTSLVSGMYKLKDSLLFDDTNSSHLFLLWYCHYFMGAFEAIHYFQGTVFISQHLLQVFIIVSSLWLIRGNLKGTVFIWGKKL